jgi:hypothetical protein
MQRNTAANDPDRVLGMLLQYTVPIALVAVICLLAFVWWLSQL